MNLVCTDPSAVLVLHALISTQSENRTVGR